MTAVSWPQALRLDHEAGSTEPCAPGELIAAMYSASPTPILAAGEDRRVLFWNSAAARVFGYAAEEALQRRLPFLALPGDFERVRWVHERVFRGETVTGLEFTARHRDGTAVEVLVSAAPLTLGNGRVGGMVASFEDITLRKVAERALVESESRYRRLFEQIADGIIVHRQGSILVANGVCHRMLGLAEGETLVGRSILEFLHPDDHQRALARCEALMRGEDAAELAEYRIRRPNGEEFRIEVRSDVLLWDGEPALQFVAHDLTERFRQEEQLRAAEQQMRQAQKMDAVGRLAGGIAHDFNNVLTAIGGFSSLLRDEIAASNPMAEYVHEIERAVERATSLTRQLLTFSKRQVLQPRIIDLNQVLTELQPMLRRLLREDIVLQTSLEPVGAVVKADVSQMEQVILNLAVNARDAMPSGGQLRLETRHVLVDAEYAAAHVELEPGPYIMLAVTDTGIGMSPEVQERIFEPFYTTKATGTGLGLSTVYGIVQQSNGGLWVYSEPGRGTRFKIFLPAQAGTPEATGTTSPELERQRSATVLLVEDDPAVQRLTQRILQRAGMAVITAADGREALELARRHGATIQVVLTDVVMPEMQGPELVSELRRERPDLRAIFMSGYAEETVVGRSGVRVDAPVVEKPFSAATLLAAIDRVLHTA